MTLRLLGMACAAVLLVLLSYVVPPRRGKHHKPRRPGTEIELWRPPPALDEGDDFETRYWDLLRFQRPQPVTVAVDWEPRVCAERYAPLDDTEVDLVGALADLFGDDTDRAAVERILNGDDPRRVS